MTTLHEEPAGDGTVLADPVEHVAAALRTHNIEAVVVEDGEAARAFVVNLIPEGAEVHSGKSKTLEDIGLYSELVESGRYDAIRPRMFAMDRATQGREIRSTCPPVR
jgi:LUD domain